MTPTQPLWNSVLFNQTLFGGGGTPPGAVIDVGHGLIYPALRKAGVTLGPQRTPSPAQFQDALEELARLTGSLNCDRLFIYSLDIRPFALQSGQMSYTIGQDPTGQTIADWDAPRPQAITAANLITGDPGTTLPYPVLVLTDQAWSRVTAQDRQAGLPNALYNDRGYPLSTISVVGQPVGGMSLQLFLWNQVPVYRSLDDVVLLPPGYEDTLVTNLAVRLAPHFQLQVHPDVRQQARESLMRLESLNAPQPIADISALGCHRPFNIYSGE